MAKFKVKIVDNKNIDWKVVTLINEMESVEEDVSVNRKNKQGEVFPRFDDIKEGSVVNGDFWRSPGGKSYLFAPKPEKTYNSVASGARKSAMMDQVMEKKAAHIATAMDQKELGIKISSTLRMATDASIAEYESGRGFTYGDTLIENIKGWRGFFWLEWEKNDSDFQPF